MCACVHACMSAGREKEMHTHPQYTLHYATVISQYIAVSLVMTMSTCRCLFKPTKKCYEERFGDTKEACGIVAGAAALVLERFPRYSPEKVKQYLVSEATDGAINMYQLLPRIRAKTPNKLLYFGNDGCMGKLNVKINVCSYSIL